jgi:hypothetical protein
VLVTGGVLLTLLTTQAACRVTQASSILRITSRAVPLAEGVIAESAEARFRDGRLEIRMQAAPSETSRGRKVDIRDASGSDQQR